MIAKAPRLRCRADEELLYCHPLLITQNFLRPPNDQSSLVRLHTSLQQGLRKNPYSHNIMALRTVLTAWKQYVHLD